ncbi:MAG: hypothetical protein NC111_07655, partial [Bacteroides sp.]|nr:hypothetical protein [Bacteroides sp.]MCM1414224.1 hypothetical protein [Bacteroides sp.]MCM1472383.1 hypothetical protein [Bacteroides sp.]
MRSTYYGNTSSLSASSTIGGSAYATHPSVAEQTCSNPSDPMRRVRRWRWDGVSLSADGFYGAGELECVITTDGDGRTSATFTDCLGATVLTRQVIGEGNVDGNSNADGCAYADTYTVSDRFGIPLIVIPPELSRLLSVQSSASSASVSDLIDRFAFVYSYDRQLRLRSKKLPGCDPICYGYDSEERLAFSRDGNQARSGRRTFFLYDRLGRVAVTGTCRDALNESEWMAASEAHVCWRVAGSAAGERSTFLGSGYEVEERLKEKFADPQLISTTFYDDYSFIPIDRHSIVMPYLPSTYNRSPLGLPTGSLTAVLGANSVAPRLSVTYYDREERPVATLAEIHTGGWVATQTQYSIGGLPMSVASRIIDSKGQEVSYAISYSYDSHGRVVRSSLAFGD